MLRKKAAEKGGERKTCLRERAGQKTAGLIKLNNAQLFSLSLRKKKKKK